MSSVFVCPDQLKNYEWGFDHTINNLEWLKKRYNPLMDLVTCVSFVTNFRFLGKLRNYLKIPQTQNTIYYSKRNVPARTSLLVVLILLCRFYTQVNCYIKFRLYFKSGLQWLQVEAAVQEFNRGLSKEFGKLFIIYLRWDYQMI